MNDQWRSPFLFLPLSFFAMWFSVWFGVFLRKRQQDMDKEVSHDFEIVLTATLTLLGLIIGFTFSMATNRYDQRKNYEEAEANAIGTEYVRADLLPASDAANVRNLLKKYLDLRILYYQTRGARDLELINAHTATLQIELWSAVKVPVTSQQSSITALVLSGMNDVLNSQGYTQAAWWNRIPTGAWGLMTAVAICACLLVGYTAHRAADGHIRLLILPLILSIAFFLIADIDGPRRGVIRVLPQNLISLAQSLPGH
jgi:hypothetical protein